jgi:hypothetical protein
MSSRTIVIEFDPIAVGISEIYGETAATITSIVDQVTKLQKPSHSSCQRHFVGIEDSEMIQAAGWQTIGSIADTKTNLVRRDSGNHLTSGILSKSDRRSVVTD